MASPSRSRYAKWTKQELIAALERRTNSHVASDQLNRVYVRRLLELDRRPPGVFRFMDLPAEMRNNIYEELLVNEDRWGRLVAHPAIISTCKSVYREAASILNAESHIHLEIICTSSSGPAMMRNTVDSGRRWSPLNELVDLHSLVYRRFSRIQSTNIAVDYNYNMRGNHDGILSVIKFFKGAGTIFKEIRSLQVRLKDGRHNKENGRELVLELLAPLKVFQNEGKLTLTGVDQGTMKEFLK